MANINTTLPAISPIGAKIYGQDILGVAGWLSPRAEVVPIIGTDATANTAAINAALLGGNKTVVINDTANINGQIVIYSNTNLIMAPGSKIRCDNSFTVTSTPIIVNHAQLAPQRTIAYSGTIAGGAISVTHASITSADIGRSIYIPLARSTAGIPSEKFLFCTTITSVTGTTATLLKPTMIDTVNPSILIYDRDQNIAITGGAFDRNVTDGIPSNGNSEMSLFFRHVDRLYIGDMHLITDGTATKYAINIADASAVIAERLRFNTNSDGIHFLGECYNITLRDFYGRTEDDFAAFTCLDYAGYSDTVGDIENVNISNMHPNQISGARTVMLLGGAGCRLKNFIIDGIYGKSSRSLAIIDDPGNGSSSTLAINIKASNIQSSGYVYISSTHQDSSIFIDGINISENTAPFVLVTGNASILRISGITINNDFKLVGANQIIKILSTATVKDLSILTTNVSLVATYGYGYFLTVEGTVETLTIDGYNFICPARINDINTLVKLYPSAVVGNMCMNTLSMTNGHAALMLDAGATCGVVTINNYKLKGCSKFCETSGSLSVNLGCGATASSVEEEFKITGAGNLTITGNGEGLSRANSIWATATQVTKVNSPYVRVDVSKLTPANGDRAWNTNASLGTLGVAGPVIYSTGTGWHLMADTTKVYMP